MTDWAATCIDGGHKMKRIAWILSVSLTLWCACPTPIICADSQPPDTPYVAATGHVVQGAFLRFFRAYGGEALLGAPLTDEFILAGHYVQCFAHVALQRPLDASGDAVVLRPIGELLHKAQPPLPANAVPSGTEAAARYFAATGHTVCHAFLDFFEAHGGAAFFGPPITEIVVEDGVIVQYFRNASLEWHPAEGEGYCIRLGNLGKSYLATLQLPASLTRPAELAASTPAPARAPAEMPAMTIATPSPASVAAAPSPTATPPRLPLLPAAASDLQLYAAVKYPVTAANGYQTVYVQVRDWRGERVTQAKVDVILRSNARVPQAFSARTDDTGRAVFTFDLSSLPAANPVVVDVRASTGGTKGFAQTIYSTAP